MILLRCVRNNEWKPNGKITVGKVYEYDRLSEVAELDDAYVGSYSSYYIKDDNGEYKYFLKECFINIQEERQNKLEQLGI